MIGLSWLAHLLVLVLVVTAVRQPDDILQPFNTVACNAATNNATMRKLETLADRKPKQSQTRDERWRQVERVRVRSVANKQKTISRKLTEILQCCFIIKWGQSMLLLLLLLPQILLLLFGATEVCLTTLGLTTCCALIMSPAPSLRNASFEILCCGRDQRSRFLTSIQATAIPASRFAISVMQI